MKPISKASVVSVYRRYAPVYDLVFGRVLESGRIELAEAVADCPPQTLLEVGVGTGLALLHYPSEVLTCGVDFSLDMLRGAQTAVEIQRLGNALLLCADAEMLPFPDGSFDCITLPYILSVTPHPQELLDEMRRVCAPGGRILVLNHFKNGGVWKVAERLLAPLADRVGFSSTLTIDILDSPHWQIMRVRSVNLFGLSKLVEIRNTSE